MFLSLLLSDSYGFGCSKRVNGRSQTRPATANLCFHWSEGEQRLECSGAGMAFFIDIEELF